MAFKFITIYLCTGTRILNPWVNFQRDRTRVLAFKLIISFFVLLLPGSEPWRLTHYRSPLLDYFWFTVSCRTRPYSTKDPRVFVFVFCSFPRPFLRVSFPNGRRFRTATLPFILFIFLWNGVPEVQEKRKLKHVEKVKGRIITFGAYVETHAYWKGVYVTNVRRTLVTLEKFLNLILRLPERETHKINSYERSESHF